MNETGFRHMIFSFTTQLLVRLFHTKWFRPRTGVAVYLASPSNDQQRCYGGLRSWHESFNFQPECEPASLCQQPQMVGLLAQYIVRPGDHHFWGDKNASSVPEFQCAFCRRDARRWTRPQARSLPKWRRGWPT